MQSNSTPDTLAESSEPAAASQWRKQPVVVCYKVASAPKRDVADIAHWRSGREEIFFNCGVRFSG